MTDPEAIREADSSAVDLLRLYEALGADRALVIRLIDGVILVHCLVADDVVPLCSRVLEAHEVPLERTVN
jgi:hypothetical protein